MAKERSDKKFDFNKSNVNRFDFTKDEPDVVEVPQQPQVGPAPVPPTLKPEKKKSTEVKILYGIAAAVAILAGIAGIYLFGIKDKDNGGAPTEQVAQAREKPKSENPETIGATDKTNTGEESATANDAETTTPSETKETSAATVNDNTSAPVSGDVEENARRVIRGDFGNGLDRKDKLGASYSEIQGRVNEMYRNGLVH